MPYLFVGGKLLEENFTAESTRWLQQTCYDAGAQFMEPPEGAAGLCELPVGRHQHDLDRAVRSALAATQEHRWTPLVPG